MLPARVGHAGNVLAVVLTLGAALFLACGTVLQHRAASEAPAHRTLAPGLFRHLVSRPVWLGGIGLMLLGVALQASALSRGAITVVEPLLVTNLMFALPISAAWLHQRLSARDWAAGLITMAGIIGFLVVGSPTGGGVHPPAGEWALAISATVACGALAIFVGSRIGPLARASAVAVAAGLGFGLSDAMVKSTIAVGTRRGLQLLATWHPYALVAVGLSAFLLAQSAYHAGHLAKAQPPISVLQPLTASLLGLWLFEEHLHTAGYRGYVEGLAVAAMIVGVVLLARSPLANGQALEKELEEHVNWAGAGD